MLYPLSNTVAMLRHLGALVAVCTIAVASLAVAASFDGASSKSDDVSISVDRVALDTHTVTLGLQAENRSDQTINLNGGDGLSLSDNRGGRYLFVPPTMNQTLTIEPNESLAGEVVFFGPVRRDISALTLTTSVPKAAGEPLALTMHAAAAEVADTVVQPAGADGPLALTLDGKTSVSDDIEMTFERIEVVPEGYRVTMTVENRSTDTIALNQNGGFNLRDNRGDTYRFQPPSGNHTVQIPPNGWLEGKFLFEGQPSPLSEHVILTTDAIQGQSFTVTIPVPVSSQRLAFTADGAVAMVLDNVTFEGDLITVDATIANMGNEPVVFNRMLGLRMHDDQGNAYPVIVPPGKAATEIPARGMGSARYVFAGPLASDISSLTLSTNATADGSQQAPNLQLELPVLAANPGPELPQSTLHLARLRESTVQRSSLGQGSTARVQQLRSDLGARRTNGGTLIALQGDVLFDLDSSALRPDAMPALDQLVELVQLMEVKEVIIEGHTDTLGDAAYNLDLSRQRANTVSTYLRERGALTHVNVLVRGLGETQPITTNETAEGRQRNRRVEITLREGRQG